MNGQKQKYVGIASDNEGINVYALREDGAVYEIHWGNDGSGPGPHWRLLLMLPQLIEE